MQDVLEDISRWLEDQEPVVLATVASTWGSSPRRVGAKMAFTPSGRIAGSVSGGCVEGAVFEAGLETLQSQQIKLLHFGVADETALEVGLACGGQIEVFVQPLDSSLFRAMKAAMDDQQSLVLGTVISGSKDVVGHRFLFTETNLTQTEVPLEHLGSQLYRAARQGAIESLASSKSRAFDFVLESGGNLRIFFDVLLPPRTLLMVGGAHISVALAAIAKAVGYRTIVLDPRRAFGSQERFPHVDQLIQAWPQEGLQDIKLTRSTAVVMLTHDPKIDDPALKIALNSTAFYIGALGSWKTQAARRERLLEEGLTPAQLDRIHGPVGLNIGSETPEEIALSIMAEIVAASHEALPAT